MNILQFISYTVFNKDGKRNEVWNEFLNQFKQLQDARWESFRNRMK
jgi:hypothetical protein